MKSRLFSGAVIVASILAGHATPARAANACADANLTAQKAREAGRFGEARAQLDKCMEMQCPAVVREDCVQRVDELDRVQPTLVFGARTGAGDDVRDVRVTMDGREIATSLDGRAIDVDPGEHVFVFERAGDESVTKTLVVREGEKARAETIVFGAGVVSPPGSSTAEPASSATTDALIAVGVGASVVGVVGLGLGIGGAVAASSAWDESQTACASAAACPDHATAVDAHDRAVDFATLSTVGFVAGGVLAAAGVTLILVGAFQENGAPASDSALAIRVVPAPVPGGGAFTLQGVFR